MALAFSVGNVTRLCLDLGVTAWIAWLVGPSVDLSVIGLLTGMRFLSLHGYTDDQLAKLNRLLRFCGLLTLALNTAGALGHRQYGTALVDAIGPVLLIGWSEIGPWLLRQINAVCSSAAAAPAAPEQPQARPAAASAAVLSRPAAGPDPGARRRAPRGNRQAHLPRQPPRPAADRPGPGQRPGRRRPRRGSRQSRAAAAQRPRNDIVVHGRLRRYDSRSGLPARLSGPRARPSIRDGLRAPRRGRQRREALVPRPCRGLRAALAGYSAEYLTCISPDITVILVRPRLPP